MRDAGRASCDQAAGRERAVDGAGAVRDEDAFDVDGGGGLAARARRPACPAGTPEVRQFPGGASNLTYLLRYPDRDLILRRPPAGTKAKGAHDMGREYRIQSALGAGVPASRRRWSALCDDEAVIGSDFYVMERLDGMILRRDLPAGRRRSTRSRRRALCTERPRRARRPARGRPVDAPALGDARQGRRATSRARSPAGRTRFRNARTDDLGDYERGDGLARRAPARRRRDTA